MQPIGAVQSLIERVQEPTMIVIAMTREIGSHGSDVAAGLINELGLTVINSEIVASNVAGRLGVEEGTVKRYLDGSASIFERWQIDTRKLSRYTAEEILTLAQQGSVLIRGWGAAALFRDIPQVISVRVCTPMALRVRLMMERLGVKDADALRQEIEHFDAAHAKTMRASFNVERDDALLYHMVLNTARMPIEACVKAICQLAQDPRFQDDATIGLALADKLLATRVSAALSDEIGIGDAPAGVTVSASNGRVTLMAASSSGSLRAKAEKVASRVPGVRAIDNRIISVPTRGGPF
jgi:cytidylate kinase